MALSALTVFEVRTTGSDTNGGGFVTGASGTDWSQQNSTQYSVTDGVAIGTTTITSATAAFGTDVVGNIMYLTGGTGSITAQWRQIVSRSSATTIVIDASISASTGMTLHIGGALASPGQASAVMVSGNDLWIKAGTYSITSASVNVSGGCLNNISSSSRTNQSFIRGYSVTRGDNVSGAILQLNVSTATIMAGLNGVVVQNLTLDGNAQTTSKGISGSGGNSFRVRNCLIENFTNGGINAGAAVSMAENCDFTGCSSQGCYVGSTALVSRAWRCRFYSNTVTPIGGGVSADHCLIYNNSGASTDGFSDGDAAVIVQNCTIFGNGRHGLNIGGNTNSMCGMFTNNLLVNNGGFGISFGASGMENTLAINNAFYNNTSGAVSSGGLTEGNVTLSADPFVASGSSNFALNNTASAGASCRAAGFPGAFPGALTTGYVDIGCAQHQDSGGGVPATPNFSGGFEN